VDRRRFLLSSLAGALATPLAAEAQQAGKVYRIGLLSVGSPSAPAGLVFEVLRELGYAPGKNLLVEARFADGRAERLRELAAELVRLNVAVIVALSNMETAAARSATNAIPIVMVFGADPVGVGFVESLSRPGGTITGTAVHPPQMAAKTLELLKEAVPKMRLVAVIFSTAFPGMAQYSQAFEGRAYTLGLAFQPVEVRQPSDLEAGFAKISQGHPDALYVVADAVLLERWPQIIAFAAQSKLPAIYTTRRFVDAGGLMSYGVHWQDLVRRSMTYVDKILKGAKPANLPVEQPTKFELVINLKTAKALGLTIPPSLLARADQVIE
jgi:putative ABC transport system substrate-binding protein